MRTSLPKTSSSGDGQNRGVKLIRAQAIVDFVVREAPGAVSVFVADTHGEVVAAATMAPVGSKVRSLRTSALR